MLLSFWKADTYNSLSSLIVICIEKKYNSFATAADLFKYENGFKG